MRRGTATPRGWAAVGALTEKFRTGENSPFGRAEMFDDTVADAYPEPQMRSITGSF